jgi:hypothetical protein
VVWFILRGQARLGKAGLGEAGPAVASQGFLQRNAGKMVNHIVNVTATIEGLKPGILMHRWAEDDEDGKTSRPVHNDYGTSREQAEKSAYRSPTGQLYMPTTAIGTLLRGAGRRHKQPSSRQSMAYIVPAAVIVTDEIALLHNEFSEPIHDFEVDARPVVIPATKGRITRYRPKIEKWRATFSAEIDTEVLSVATIHQLLEEGGRRIGIGDFRPERGGPYGRFAVINWQTGT